MLASSLTSQSNSCETPSEAASGSTRFLKFAPM